MQVGSSGEEVKALQMTLNGMGFDCGEADGIFGSGTDAGVRKAQEKIGVAVDGIWGPNSAAALAEYMGAQGGFSV